MKAQEDPRVILVVEDDSATRTLIGLWLPEDCEHRFAATLAEARAIMADVSPAVVLLDLQLPDGPGAELIPDIPRGAAIIAMSGSRRILAQPGRVVSYLPKPFDPENIRLLVGQALRSAVRRG